MLLPPAETDAVAAAAAATAPRAPSAEAPLSSGGRGRSAGDPALVRGGAPVATAAAADDPAACRRADRLYDAMRAPRAARGSRLDGSRFNWFTWYQGMVFTSSSVARFAGSSTSSRSMTARAPGLTVDG